MPAKNNRSTHPAQLAFDWSAKPLPARADEIVKPLEDTRIATADANVEAVESPTISMPSTSGLVQVLPWDFRTTFPEPREEAIEAGKLNDDDLGFENLKSLHDEHANHALTLLSDLDAIMDARRAGVDPATGKQPRTPKQRDALQKLFEEEPKRLEHAFDVLMDVYEDAFGSEAVSAFRKAIRAHHAGVEVISEFPPTPTPLREAVDKGAFGVEEDGAVVIPAADEVQAILEHVTDALAEMPEGPERKALLAKCAEDFGDQAADELDRWSKLKPEADETKTVDYDPGHPWHYYHQGDGAEPLPFDAIPARATTLEQLGTKFPKSPEKRRVLFRKMLADQRRQLTGDQDRYQDLMDRGAEALSQYDREIAHAGDDELAWASAIALKYNHISGARGRVNLLQRLVGGSLEGFVD